VDELSGDLVGEALAELTTPESGMPFALIDDALAERQAA
jgi:hypothetical protein